MIGRPFLAAALTVALTAQPEGVPRGFVNVLVLDDLLPHLEAALASPRVNDLLRRSPKLRAELESAGVQVGMLRALSRSFAHFVPKRVVVAFPETTVQAAGDLLRVTAHGVLLSLAQLEEERQQTLTDAGLDLVGRLRQMPLHVAVQARTADVAEQWFDQVSDLLESAPESAGLAVKLGGSRLEMTFTPSRVPFLSAAAKTLGWTDEVAALHWTAALSLDGDRLLLTSGAQGGKLGEDAMHPLWSHAGGARLFFAQFDLTTLDAAVANAESLFAEHDDVLAPRYAREPRARLYIEQMQTFFAGLDPKVAMSVRLLADGIDWRQHSVWGVDFADAVQAPLPVNGMLAMVDPKVTAFSLVNGQLDLMLLASLDEIRARLLRQAVRREQRAASGVEMMDSVDARLDPLREFLLEDFGEALASGCGTLAEGLTAVRSVEVLAADGAVQARWQPTDLRVPAVALLGQIDDSPAAWKFVAGLTAALAKSMFGGSVELPLAEVDLGLGVPTRGFGTTLPIGDGRKLRIDGELVPHWFECNATLVFSTSVALSKTLIARAAKPAPGVTADTFAWSRATGVGCGDLLRRFFGVMAAIATEPARDLRGALGIPDAPAATDIGAYATELALWCTALAEFDTHDRLANGELQSHTLVRWVKD